MSRQEHDALGTLQVPADAYYGIQTLRAKQNFPITGENVHPSFIQALGHVKHACAQANNAIGKLDDTIAHPIMQAADEMARGEWNDSVIVDPIQGGAGTSLNMNVNEVIANRALEIMGVAKGTYDRVNPNNHVNMAQSTNDVIPTAFRIALLVELDEAIEILSSLATALNDKSREFDQVLKMGRTHLQDAVPIRLGQEFGAYARVIQRDVARLKDARPSLFIINMGATAVGTGLNADPAYIEKVAKFLAERTGYPLTTGEDLVDATQNIDALIHVSGLLKTCAVNLVKIANDLRLMASGPKAGFSDIELPSRQPGSSIMPGKVNPVMPELINQVAFQIIGNDHTASLVGQAGQLELNVMQPVLFYGLLQSVNILRNSVDVFTRFAVVGIEANERHTRQIAENSPSLATALNPFIGYKAASEVARLSLETGKSVRDIVLEQGLLPEETLNRVLQPDTLTQPRSLD